MGGPRVGRFEPGYRWLRTGRIVWGRIRYFRTSSFRRHVGRDYIRKIRAQFQGTASQGQT